MRKFLQRLFLKPVTRIADRYTSRPDRAHVHHALTRLYADVISKSNKKGLLLEFNPSTDRFIIFSDMHKGAKNGADDFAFCEKNYLQALTHYNENNFTYIQLGDAEELWENTVAAIKKANTPSFEKEKLFLQRKAFIKIYGNHDLFWDNSPFSGLELEHIYKQKVVIYEGVVLRTNLRDTSLDIFLTHGHQGDELSDGNWFTKWFIANIWAPLQSYLLINPNTPAYYNFLKTVHNKLMYEWIAPQQNKLLITGHTHQPVFQSLTHLELLYRKLSIAKANNDETAIRAVETEIEIKHQKGQMLPDFSGYMPTYFNSGCCCFNDGDITGIEIDAGQMSLIKWEYNSVTQVPERVLLDTVSLSELVTPLTTS
jgi:predicted phosphodiesterase